MASELLVTMHSGRSATNGVFPTWTGHAGMTELAEAASQATGSSNASFSVNTLVIAAGAVTGAKTATSSSTVTGSRGVSFLLAAA